MIAEIWSSVKGKPQGNFSRYVEAASLQYGVDQRIIHAVIETESQYKIDALPPKGARGLLQFMPNKPRSIRSLSLTVAMPFAYPCMAYLWRDNQRILQED